MSLTATNSISMTDAQQYLEHHLHLFGEARWQQRRKAIECFLTDFRESETGQIVLDEIRVRNWMIKDVSGRSLWKSRCRLGMISRFIHELYRAGLISNDPIEQFRAEFCPNGWVHLVPVLQSDAPCSNLDAMRTPRKLVGPLTEHVQSYLALNQALGKKYHHERQDLSNFMVFLGVEGISSVHEITSKMIESWFDEQQGEWRTRHAKICRVNRFFNYLLTTKQIESNPIPQPLLEPRAGVPKANPPFIFSLKQIEDVVDLLGKMPVNQVTPWRRETCQMMAILQYSLGLRHGELRRIRIRDIDMSRKTLFIDQTKFYKSRCLPFGPKIEKNLQGFLEFRKEILAPIRDDHPLFVSRWRTPMGASVFGEVFREALQTLKITTLRGSVPRTHDLRHSFAVHRLLCWYREGVDVQSRLPWLSAYLGHINIQSTEVYLTITTELLEQANARFFSKFGCEVPERSCH